MAATIIIPTRGRPDYLDVTLASVAPRRAGAGAELLVVDDGADAATARVAAAPRGPGARPGGGRGANGARNAGVAATSGDPVVFIDDDIAGATLARALLDGAAAAHDVDVFGGPITARIEGGPHSCGREGARSRPSTTARPTVTWSSSGRRTWRSAAARCNGSDRSTRRSAAAAKRRTGSGATRRSAVASAIWPRAGIEHRRAGPDARLRALARSGYALGRTARRYDTLKGAAPTLRTELRVLAGCAAHAIRWRCPNMVAVGAHAAGRVREALAEPGAVADVGADDFLSGESGEVSGIRATARAMVGDALGDLIALVRAEPWRLRASARSLPRRRVLVLAIERTDAEPTRPTPAGARPLPP